MTKNVFDGHGETAKSTPVAGHTTGGGASYGLAEHHQRAGEAGGYKFSSGHPQQHFHAEHHKTGSHGGGADSFCGTKKSGQLCVSGVKGAHQIGKR